MNTPVTPRKPLNTSRFGTVSVSPSQILTFPEGVLGFYDLRTFAIIKPEDDELFHFLQSCESPNISFPIIPQAKAPKDMSHFGSLGLELWSIVTIPDDVTAMTANEKAPIVLNRSINRGAQVVSTDSNMQIRTPIFDRLRQRTFNV